MKKAITNIEHVKQIHNKIFDILCDSKLISKESATILVDMFLNLDPTSIMIYKNKDKKDYD